MPSKRKKDRFDALTARIFLVLLGLSFVVTGSLLLYWSGETATTPIIFGWMFGFGGITLAICGLALSDTNAIKFSEKTGNHEVMILFALASLGLAWLIRRIWDET